MAGVGFILGAGIYVLIGAVAKTAGSALWLSFLFAGLAALFSGFSYAELSSLFPVIESEYVYVTEGMNKFFGFFAYISVILALTIGLSAVSLGFAGYFSQLFNIGNVILIAFCTIFFFAFVNWFSIKYASKFVFVSTILSILGLLTIVALSFFGNSPSTNFLIMPEGLLGVIKGASLILFAYLGFEGVAKIADETKNARKNIPLAIILSIVISMIIYVLVAIAAVNVLPWQVLATSKAPLADVAAAVLGNKAFVFLGIIALFSTASTILMGLLSGSRGFYGIGLIFPKFKWISKVGNRNTPARAIFLTSIIAIPFLFFKDISMIVGFTNFLIFSTFIFVNLSVIKLRYRKPNLKRKFKMPLNINNFPLLSLFGIIISVFLMVNLDLIHIIGGAFIALLIYLLYKKINKKGLNAL
jgi:APA family basic amino acid/polyamine antiporter